ncbi:MAG: tyrosine-protein phosphatase, partial [Clostridia bacterium]|nr:tyrosine-protein phosphatase [Clostridia bacterium]
MRTSKLKLKKLNNARDLGGLKAEGGKTVKYGMLIRSGKLYNLPEKTLAYFKSLGVSAVIDLRIDTEVSEYPDTVIDGAEYIRLPLLCTATAGITRDKKMVSTMNRESKRIKKEFGNADEYIKEMYRRILTDEEPRATLKRFFEILLSAEGCVIWHCSGGKDRAGICAMLLEGLLGVSEENIIDDFTASQ